MKNWDFRKIEHGHDGQYEPTLCEWSLGEGWKALKRERMKVFCHCCQSKRPDLALDIPKKMRRQSTK